MFSPIEKEYYKALNSSIYNDIKVKPGIDNFSVQTKELISELISLFIESERCYEKWRNQFYKLQHFTAKYIFDKFDTFGKNYISSFDIERNSYTSKILYNLKDIQLIFLVYDKDKDNKISYSEFSEELFPKSNYLLNRKNI